MNSIENGVYGIKGSFSETHKSFQIHFGLCGKEFSKLIVTYLYYTKYDEIKIFHSVVQKHPVLHRIIQKISDIL